MKYKNLGTLLLSLSLLMAVCCVSCGDEQQPDVDDIKVEINSLRLDKDMASIDTNAIGEGLSRLKQKYPAFLDFYLDTLMGFQVMGNYSDSNPGVAKGVRTFLTHPDFRGLFDTIAKHYPDTKEIDAALNKGFQYLRHYYPNYFIPQIIYVNSNLTNYAAFTYDTVAIGIGLDMYLGEQYPFYRSVDIPEYAIKRCKREYIPVNVFKSIYTSMHPFSMDNRTLLDMMVQKGKEQYFLRKTLPFVDEHIRLGFTKAQLEWCEASEAAVYNFFIEKQFLYSTNLQQVLRYVMDGPSASMMPAESPGNIGTWIGYRIVQAYVDKNKNISLQQLFEMKDAQQLLQQAKYKPQ